MMITNADIIAALEDSVWISGIRVLRSNANTSTLRTAYEALVEYAQLRRERDDAVNVVASLRAYLYDQFDVGDRSDGTPSPNEYMRVAQKLDELQKGKG